MTTKQTAQAYTASNRSGAETARYHNDVQPMLKSPLTGRIFAKNPHTSTPHTPHTSALPNDKHAAHLPGGLKAAPSQYQMISLLRTLNEKLKMTEIERSSMQKELRGYRKIIRDLETKSSKTEEQFSALNAQLSRSPAPENTRLPNGLAHDLKETQRLYHTLEHQSKRTQDALKNLEKKAQSHKQLTKAMSQKQIQLERFHKQYDDLMTRVEKTENRNVLMDEKLQSVLEAETRFSDMIEEEKGHRARFLRKLEKLEDAVLSLYDQNNAAALPTPNAQDSPKLHSLDVDTHLQDDIMHVPHYMVKPTTSETLHDTETLGERAITYLYAVQAWGKKALNDCQLAAGDVWEYTRKRPLPFIMLASLSTVLLTWGVIHIASPTLQHNTQPNSTYTLHRWDTNSLTEYAPPAITNTAPGAAKPEDIQAIPSGTAPSSTQQQTLEPLIDGTKDNKAAAILNTIEPGLRPTLPADTDSPPQTPPPAAKTYAPINTPDTSANTPLPNTDPRLPQIYKPLERQALAGNHKAQHDLGTLYSTGNGSLTQDYGRAAFWFNAAAQGGIANATYNMGVLYHQGLGVPRNPVRAVEWYQSAAHQGHPEAAYNLGLAYIEGVGVTYDPYKASLHFEKAASEGTREAAYNLGLIYENGLLGTINPGQALLWYQIAADQGLKEAQTALGKLVASLGIQKSEIDAIIKTLRQSSETIDSAAQKAQSAR